jgi:rhodanese-related sulfurtransferase
MVDAGTNDRPMTLIQRSTASHFPASQIHNWANHINSLDKRSLVVFPSSSSSQSTACLFLSSSGFSIVVCIFFFLPFLL